MQNRSQTSFRGYDLGFTLFELVLVLALLSVLVTLSLGFYLKGRSDVKLDRAKADLQVIQQALESYRARFGDYPKIPDSYTGLGIVDTEKEYLLNALFGKIGPAGQAVSGIPVMVNSAILEYANAALPYKDEASAVDSLKSNWFVDPWGNAYEYNYRPQDGSWLVFGYELRSFGPNGAKEANGDDLLAE